MQVYKGTLNGVRDVAIKCAINKASTETTLFLKEIAILRACRDPSIVAFYGASLQG